MGADLTGIGTALQAAEGIVQTGVGLIEGGAARKRQRGLLAQRQTFQTPDEIGKILNLTLNQAGGDTISRNYSQNGLDNAFSSYFGTAERLGANANDLSSGFQQYMQGQFKIGDQFHQSNTEQFSKVLSAYGLVAQNKEAEYVSKQDLLKDRLSAEGLNLQSAAGNIQGGLNTTNAAISSYAIQQLYKNQAGNDKPLPTLATDNTYQGVRASYERGYMV